MAQKSPNSIDVVDIQFKLHGKARIFNVSESATPNSNLLAVSSAHGVLFAGDPEKPEFKVFISKNLIDNENSDTNILVRTVPLPERPTVVACSCDGGFLAVNYVQNGSSFLQIFETASLLTDNISSPYKIPLSADGNAVCEQILWNPVIANNLAVILKNGGLTMYTLKDGGQYEMHNLDKSHQVQCGCWSPKGKQIVLGFANGKLQQFKPELTAAKTIVCPPNIHAGPFSTIAVHWLSTFQFAVAFLQNGDDNVPSLYIVNAPKGGTPTYINYYDVCYTTGQRQHQMFFTHIQQWNLLLVTSANGIEVGLLGCRDNTGDTPTWIQYTLLDEARIEMPLTANKDETFSTGFGLDTSCSHRLVINENQLPVMPMIHLISTNGLLLSFNFLNLSPGAADICSPPPPISYSAQQFKILNEILKPSAEGKMAAPAEVKAPTPAPAATPPNLIASTPLTKDKTSTFFGGASAVASQQLSNFGNALKTATNTATSVAPVKPTASIGFGAGFGAANNGGGGLTFAGLGAQQQNLSQTLTQSKPQFQPQIHQQHQQQHQQKPSQQSTAVVSGVKSSELNKPLYTVPPNFTPPTSTTNDSQPTAAAQQKSQSNVLMSSKMQTGFLELIAVQINSFDKEIKQSGSHSKGLLKNIGNPEEMRACTKRLNDLHEIIEQANDHDFEMDVQNLRHTLNEARFMVAESRWKLEKHKNPDLPRLGNNTADAANRRQLVKLQSYVTANEAQMQLLKYLIDVQWSNFQDAVRRNTKSQIHIPCLDGIYQRMTKMQETLVRQRSKINRIKTKLQQNGLLHKVINNSESSFVNGKHEVTMESLADSILSMTLAQVVDEDRAKLSTEKLSAIREFTRQRKTVNIIKPHRPNRVGLRSEVVLETILQSERSKMRETLNANKTVEQKQEAQKPTKEPLLPKPTATKPLVSSTAQLSFVSTSIGASPGFSFGNSTSFIKTTPAASMPTGLKPDLKVNNQLPQHMPQALSFKAPAQAAAAVAPNGFGLPNINVQATSIEVAKAGLQTPEDEVPNVPQSPISFAAKVIGGSNAINQQNIAPQTLTADKEFKKLEEAANRPFSFAPATSGASSIFSGLGSKPSLLDTKGAANFSFGGFAASKADSTSTAVTSIITITTTNNPAVTGLFSGLGKSASVEASAAPASLSLSASIASKPPIVSEAPPVASQTSLAPPVAATTVTSATSSSTAKDPSDSLFGELNICKPTTKPTDTEKPAGNLFSGFGAVSSSFSFTPVSGNSSFSFADLSKSIETPATKPAEAPATTTITTSITTTSIAKEPTPAMAAPAAATPVTTSKSTEFSFGLDALGTTVSTIKPAAETIKATTAESVPNANIFSTSAATVTTTTTTTPSTGFFAAPIVSSSSTAAPISTSASIFGSIGLTQATTTTAAAAVTSSTAPPTNVGIFSSAAAQPVSSTTTTSVSSGGSLFASVPPPTSTSSTSLTSTFAGFGVSTTAASATTAATTAPTTGSIFANAAASAPTSGSIFGGIPKPEQSVFANATTTSPQAQSTGLFATAAQNASPFGAATTSPPPNQTVNSGGLFSGGFSGFAKPAGTGSIFGGGNAASPFGGAGATSPPAAQPTGGSIFGKPAEGGGIFSGGNQQQTSPAASGGGSIFGTNVFGSTQATSPPPSGLFASAAQSEPNAFGQGASLFGGAANTSGTSGGPLFGAAAPVAPSSFGSPSATTGSTGFGAFSQPTAGSPFSSPTNANTGIFGQAAGQAAQGGFGSPQQASAFSKPVFGGPATFGSPPAFGAQPTFGGAATFGAPKSPFGSFANATANSPATGVFGAPTQQNSLFESLSSTDTGLSFGNLAQGASGNAPKPAFGGSSFTSYRS